ncbi:MAG: hypothetical protein V6D39_09070 [Dolichospermum lemmermannii FEM_B0920]
MQQRLRYRTPISQTAIAHNPLILNDSYGALRYRTSHPQTAIAYFS